MVMVTDKEPKLVCVYKLYLKSSLRRTQSELIPKISMDTIPAVGLFWIDFSMVFLDTPLSDKE